MNKFLQQTVGQSKGTILKLCFPTVTSQSDAKAFLDTAKRSPKKSINF